MTEIDPKLSRLYREASSESPPAELDAAILAAARRHVAKPRRRTRPFWMRWAVPASALATLVVAVSVAFLAEREQPVILDDTASGERPTRPQSAPDAAAETAKAKASESTASVTAAKNGAPATEAPTMSIAPAQAPAVTLPWPAQMPTPRPAESAPAAAQAFPEESRPKAAAAGAAAPNARAESNAASDAAPGAAGTTAVPPPAGAGRLAPLRQQEIPRSAQAWIDEITRLKREGREKEAAEKLAEFRKAYPEYALPEGLRNLQK